jgi:hypothetical protein
MFTPGLKTPQHFAVDRIEREKVAFRCARKHQIACRRQQAAPRWNPCR